jgi:FdhD protein
MNNHVEKIPIKQYTADSTSNFEEPIAREFPVTIVLNDRELVTMLCSPDNMEYLAAGFLSSEDLIKNRDEIKKIAVDERHGIVRVETIEDKQAAEGFFLKRWLTSSNGRGAGVNPSAGTVNRRVDSDLRISSAEISALADIFQRGSKVYHSTHGVHSAALSDGKELLTFFEDVGRHNAIDKVFGKCLLDNIPTDGRILLTSGRVSSDSVFKAAKRNIPIIISIAVATDRAIRIADDLGITLVGHASWEKMNVYTRSRRVVLNNKT